MNYETVKYFQNETVEIKRYDRYLQQYNLAALRVEVAILFLSLSLSVAVALMKYFDPFIVLFQRD
jgi:ATP-binding cassette subfamily B (MDR/TAP) protein 7